jgi:hypothetical protein
MSLRRKMQIMIALNELKVCSVRIVIMKRKMSFDRDLRNTMQCYAVANNKGIIYGR